MKKTVECKNSYLDHAVDGDLVRLGREVADFVVNDSGFGDQFVRFGGDFFGSPIPEQPVTGNADTPTGGTHAIVGYRRHAGVEWSQKFATTGQNSRTKVLVRRTGFGRGRKPSTSDYEGRERSRCLWNQRIESE